MKLYSFSLIVFAKHLFYLVNWYVVNWLNWKHSADLIFCYEFALYSQSTISYSFSAAVAYLFCPSSPLFFLNEFLNPTSSASETNLQSLVSLRTNIPLKEPDKLLNTSYGIKIELDLMIKKNLLQNLLASISISQLKLLQPSFYVLKINRYFGLEGLPHECICFVKRRVLIFLITRLFILLLIMQLFILVSFPEYKKKYLLEQLLQSEPQIY